jgi:hypothetical protein
MATPEGRPMNPAACPDCGDVGAYNGRYCLNGENNA